MPTGIFHFHSKKMSSYTVASMERKLLLISGTTYSMKRFYLAISASRMADQAGGSGAGGARGGVGQAWVGGEAEVVVAAQPHDGVTVELVADAVTARDRGTATQQARCIEVGQALASALGGVHGGGA
jgi:hypothetical protein